MSIRVRILLFLLVLCLDAVFIRRQPWGVIIGCVAYLALVFPAIKR